MIIRIIEIIIYAIIAIGGNVLAFIVTGSSLVSGLLGVIGLMGMALLIKTICLTDAQIDKVKGVIEDDVDE